MLLETFESCGVCGALSPGSRQSALASAWTFVWSVCARAVARVPRAGCGVGQRARDTALSGPAPGQMLYRDPSA